MKLTQLRYLVATVDEGTMTEAAASLFVSQPALTRAVRALERELGLTLLVRDGRRVRLTDSGREAVEIARRVLHDVDSLGRLAPGVVPICATHTQARELCAGAVSRLARSNPRLVVSLDTVPGRADVIRAVRSGDATLGVCDLPVEAELTTVPLCRQELSMICPPDWDLGRLAPLEVLNHLDFIAPVAGSQKRREMDAAFAAAGFEPNVTMEVDQWDLVVPMVVDGVGATLAWPAHTRAAEALGARVVSLDPPLRRDVGVVHRVSDLDAGARAVVDALRAEADQMSTPLA